MIGDNHRVRDFKDEPVQGAYQAPNWIDPQQAMTLSSLMRYPTQLTSRGAVLPAIHLNLNMAPDIYAIDGPRLNSTSSIATANRPKVRSLRCAYS